MEQNRTDKTVLVKGLKLMGICLFLMFAGPTLLHFTFLNKDKGLFIPLLIVSILVCMLAIYYMYRGIQTIMDSIFKKKN